ncbi:MAG: hypothetical protein AAF828_06480, partial [Bacteroidota bacterium]
MRLERLLAFSKVKNRVENPHPIRVGLCKLRLGHIVASAKFEQVEALAKRFKSDQSSMDYFGAWRSLFIRWLP